MQKQGWALDSPILSQNGALDKVSAPSDIAPEYMSPATREPGR